MYNNKTSFFLKQLVEMRNPIAHGRKSYYDKAVYPVLPFFPIIKNLLYPIDYLRIFTARIISGCLNANFYHEEWIETEKELIVSHSEVKDYLKKGEFKKLTDSNDDIKSTILYGVNHFMLSKKITHKEAHSFYEFYLEQEQNNSHFLCCNVEGIIILLESTEDKKIMEKAEQAILYIHENEILDTKIRDVKYLLEYNGFNTNKIEKMLLK